MITLKEYLERKGHGGLAALAAGAGVSSAAIYKIATKERRASRKMAEKIEEATGGQVSAASLIPHLVPRGYRLVRADEMEVVVCTG